MEALEGHFGALEGLNLGKKVKLKDRIRIWIRFRVKGIIWIRIKAMRIPNTACQPSISLLSSHFLPTSIIFQLIFLLGKSSLFFHTTFSREDFYHEIFDFRFFSRISFAQAPVSNFRNSWRYSQLKLKFATGVV